MAGKAGNKYWESRKDRPYYQVVRTLISHIGQGAKSIIDVGTKGCAYLDWFDFIPIRTSVDLRRPYEAKGIRSIKSDFLTWVPDQHYDIVTCLQGLEHSPSAAEFAQRLLTLGDTVIVSVPYQWPHGKAKSHVHDPIDEDKLFSWFRRRPNFEFICPEVKSPSEHIIHVYDKMPEAWSTLNRRDALLRNIKVRAAPPIKGPESVVSCGNVLPDQAARAVPPLEQVIDAPCPHCYEDYIKLDEMRKSADSLSALDATTIRTCSTEGRKLFAWRATNKMGTLDQLICAMEAWRSPARTAQGYAFLRRLDAEWSARLARLLMIQAINPDDNINALTLYRFLFENRDPKSLGTHHTKLFFDLALQANDIELARKILKQGKMVEGHRRFAEIDLLNPNLSDIENFQSWLSGFNHFFFKEDLEGVEFKEPSQRFADFMPFDRLASKPASVRHDGPRVTVVVSVWEPKHALVTSVRSILTQSWKNLEVLLVDDACGEEYQQVIRYCTDLDERVRVLRQERNQGTYAARNLALHEARGEFITFQDADDWSHPRRIEKQVEPLLSDSNLMATTSRAARTDEALCFSYRGHTEPVRLNTSSLMFRLSPVKERIGFFDSVRKSADSEYLQRIKVAFGDGAYLALPSVLALVRLRAASLSRSDFRPGWHHPSRVVYRNAYTYWHERIATDKSSPYRSEFAWDRPFPAPAAFSIEGSHVPAHRHYDVVLIGDWLKAGGPQASMTEEIEALKELECSIAVINMEAFRFMSARNRFLNDNIRKMIHEGVVDHLTLTDDVEASVLLIRYPPILQFPPAGKANIRAKSAILVVNQAPHEMDGSDLRYEVHDCIRNAKELFDIDPVWVPQGPLVRDVIAPLIPQQLLARQNFPAIISPDRWEKTRRASPEDLPVIGRYSRDNLMKFPENADILLQCYPTTPDIRVRIMGGKKSCSAILGTDKFPKNWEMFEYKEMPALQFLDTIDFFVHFDHKNIVEAFGRSLLEAIASGRVVILPHKFEKVFGAGAVYCAPHQVHGTVMRFWKNMDAYQRQSDTARRVVREHFGRETFVQILRELAPELSKAPRKASRETTSINSALALKGEKSSDSLPRNRAKIGSV